MNASRWAQLGLVLLAVLLVRVPLLSPGGWLAFDDLIPLMYPHQVLDFLSSSWNDYYQWPEVRGRYSLLGTPFRYLPLIPVGLLLGSLLAALGAFRLTLYVRRIAGLSTAGGPVGPFVAGAFYLLLVLASKAHQLHTLFLGMGLLPWTLLAFLKAIYAAPASRAGWAWAGLAALLLLANPAIHLVLLGFVAVTGIAVVVAVFERRGRALGAWGVMLALGLVPYGIALWLSGPGLTTAATASVPPGLLEAWSGPFGPRLLLPMGLSLPETLRAETYVFLDQLLERHLGATLASSIFPALALGALGALRRRPLIAALGLLWLGSVFFATGTYYSFSGYRGLIALTELPGLWGVPAKVVLAVLRNPDRWLLLASLMLATLTGLGLSLAEKPLLRFRSPGLRAALQGALVLIALLPFAIHPAFRPLGAGDVGGVFRPVPLPEAYREALALIRGEKTLYLPPMGARPLRWNLSKKTQDEALLLLHGGPSMEGVTGSPLLNQLYLMYAYREMLYERKSAALGPYLSLGNFRYLLFHDDVEDPVWPDEFSRVREALGAQRDLVLRFEREGVALFENPAADAPPKIVPLEGAIVFGGSLDEAVSLLEAGVEPRRVGLLNVGEGDLEWPTFVRWAEALGSRLLVYLPPSLAEEDLRLGLLAAEAAARGEGVGYPEVGYGAGARLWWDHRWLNITAFNFVKFRERYGLFGVEGAQDYKLAATIAEGAEVVFPFRVSESGAYALFLRASAPLGGRLLLDLDGLYSREVELPPSRGYRFQRVERLRLRAGEHRLRLRTLTNKPVVLNLVYAAPVRQLDEAERLWEELRARISRADSPAALKERLNGLHRSLNETRPPIALYGYYGPVYWKRRALEVKQGEALMRVPPKRSWLIGHLYALPGDLSPEQIRLAGKGAR